MYHNTYAHLKQRLYYAMYVLYMLGSYIYNYYVVQAPKFYNTGSYVSVSVVNIQFLGI